jgi:hypothetical protein
MLKFYQHWDNLPNLPKITLHYQPRLATYIIYLLVTAGFLCTFNNTIPHIEPTASLQQSPNDTVTAMGSIQTHAVVHMGPHKTGSTSIQFQSRNSIKDLNKDGYDMPWVVANK